MSSLYVMPGQTVTTSTSMGGMDTIEVAAGGVISVDTASPDIVWSSDLAGGAIGGIFNSGAIAQTGTGPSAQPAIGTLGAAPLGMLLLDNLGTISSAEAAALDFGSVPAGGWEFIDDSGVISGVAIQFGAGDDTLFLRSGYSIIGRVDGGAGVNTLGLTGAAGGSIRGASEFDDPGGSMSFAGFDRFDIVNDQSGAWSLYGGGHYDTLSIAANAGFTVDAAGAASHGAPSDTSFSAALTGGGLFAVTGSAVATLLPGTAFSGAIDLYGGSLFIGGAVGDITASGSPDYAVGVLNEGSIGSFTGPVSVNLNDPYQGVALGNFSEIFANISLSAYADLFANTGWVYGNIDLGGGDDSFLDTGMIQGNVNLGAGNDIAAFLSTPTVNGLVYGGPGADTFIIAMTEGHVTIADFSRAEGDVIDLSAYPIDSLADIRSHAVQSGPDTVITLAGATLTLAGVQLSSLDAAAFNLIPLHPSPVATGDVEYFRNPTTGDWGYMSANPAGGETWHPIGPSSPDYAVIGKGDFDGDGVPDVAYRQSSTGDWGFLSVNPRGGETWHFVGPTSTAYEAIGTGDFNGDGVLDIAFRQVATGDWGFMSANPGGGETWHEAGPTSTSYAAIATGDFNWDGLADIAFRNPTTGDWGYMSANPGGGETWHPIGPSSPDYEVIGSGDFNGDWIEDVAFRQVSTGNWGFLSILPTGGEVWFPVAGSTSLAYKAIGSGDYNGDGLTDIAFRNPGTGDWGFMSVTPYGGELWHPMGPSSTAYAAI